ncbi:MAG: hypothetical protein LBK67_06295 [Coriobacteriales bacterium]|nr:hypothetical protein [Coriobacteriales bacterium]
MTKCDAASLLAGVTLRDKRGRFFCLAEESAPFVFRVSIAGILGKLLFRTEGAALQVFNSKHQRTKGTSIEELARKARRLFNAESKKSKRTPYIRSAYFDREKVFINLFWPHLSQKPRGERIKRLRFIACAFDLIHNSRFAPTSRINPNNPSEMLHRFAGVTKDGYLYFVQIKEDMKDGRKSFLSVFSPVIPVKLLSEEF